MPICTQKIVIFGPPGIFWKWKLWCMCDGARCARQNFGFGLLKSYLTFGYLTCSDRSKKIPHSSLMGRCYCLHIKRLAANVLSNSICVTVYTNVSNLENLWFGWKFWRFYNNTHILRDDFSRSDCKKNKMNVQYCKKIKWMCNPSWNCDPKKHISHK